MGKKKKNGDSLVSIRDALEYFWKHAADFRGRTWGEKREGNSFSGSHITIGKGNEIITIFEDEDGEPVLAQHTMVSKTSLGETIRSIIEKEELKVKQVVPKSRQIASGGY